MIGIISKYASVAKIGLFLALFGTVGALGVLYKDALEDNAVKEQAIMTLSTRLGEMQSQIEHEQEQMAELRDRRDSIQSRYRDVVAELQQYQGRADVVMEKPELIESKVQDSFDGFMKEMECATGELSSCEH